MARVGVAAENRFIAGGGAADLETLMALRSLVGSLFELTLSAPDDEFVSAAGRREARSSWDALVASR